MRADAVNCFGNMCLTQGDANGYEYPADSEFI